VVAFVPLVAGVYWKRATKQGALLSMAGGFLFWIGAMLVSGEDPLLPAQFVGLIAATVGMIFGSLAPQMLKHDHTVHERLKKGEMADDLVTAQETAN